MSDPVLTLTGVKPLTTPHSAMGMNFLARSSFLIEDTVDETLYTESGCGYNWSSISIGSRTQVLPTRWDRVDLSFLQTPWIGSTSSLGELNPGLDPREPGGKDALDEGAPRDAPIRRALPI